MKKLAMFLLVLMILTIAPLTFTAAEDKKMPMPDFANPRYLFDQENSGIFSCDEGKESNFNFYYEKDIQSPTKEVVSEIYVYFEDKNAVKPFSVYMINLVLKTETIYLDLNRDGFVDFYGSPGDENIGKHLCDDMKRLY